MRAEPYISSRKKSNPAVSNNEAHAGEGLVDAVIEIGRDQPTVSSIAK